VLLDFHPLRVLIAVVTTEKSFLLIYSVGPVYAMKAKFPRGATAFDTELGGAQAAASKSILSD